MVMRRYSYIWIIMVALLAASCSTQKNTQASRGFHAMKVNYNIYYNGYTAFEEGLAEIDKANQDDYTTILNLYPVSNHKAAAAAKSKMDRTIEKCRKSIKLHSIKKRPEPDQKRLSDPAYRAWLKQEEFNPAMPKAWLLLGKAEFHKGDFLESIGTFNYIEKHFDYDKDVVAQCQLWSVRAYAESDWLYEAEDLLQKVHVDDLKRKNAALYSAVAADLKLKEKQYREAIPHIKIALPEEKKKGNRPRFAYVLAQLYELLDERDDARYYYKQVLNMQPAHEMDFNARIHLAQLEPNRASALRGLEKMAKQYKNKDKLDIIYGAMGNIHLAAGDTAAALESYTLGAEKSTQNGLPKAQILIKAGDIYFGRRDYVNAQPCYADAVSILSSENDDYPRVRKRSEVLSELIVEVNTVQLQDSLQHLSTLSEEEQMKVCEKIVADLIEQEKNDSIAAAQAARAAENDEGLKSVNTSGMIGGGGGSGEWYFYNQALLKQGQQQFRQKWGNRALEDNWRRRTKSGELAMLSGNEPQGEDDDDEQPNDSTDNGDNAVDSIPPVSNDPHDPLYYMQQIPRTEEDIANSNALISTALYNMVGIYQDKLEDRELADETFAELKRRFPTEPRLADLYYARYLTALKHNDTIAAEDYRLALLAEFPECSYASVVKDPKYFDKLRTMAAEQDSVYEATYNAYKRSDYATIRANKAYAEEYYPLSPLMPRFLFLNAVAVAKTDGQDAFVQELRDLVERYPESELGAMAKDFLALMNLGAESQTGGTTSSLADKRTEENLQEEDEPEPEETKANVVRIIIAHDEQQLNKLLYNVALYNFTRFMIKDFDLALEPNYSTTQSALEISGFDSPEEVEWYKGLLREDADLQALFSLLAAEIQ